MRHIYQKPNQLLATGLLLLGLASPALAQTPTFQPATNYSTGPGTTSGFGSNPNGLVAADVNGDGKLDLLTANSNTLVAAVLLGRGDGTFQNAVTYSTGTNSNPSGIAVADVNGDGNPDLLTANESTSTAGVLLGNGNGSFRTVTTYSVGGGAPADIAVADVNGDGRPDLLTANSFGGTAGVLLGTGNGTFQAATTYSTGVGSRPSGIAAADVNGDGKLDLLTANFASNTAAVLLGNGDGTFRTVTAYAVGTGNIPADIAVADVNGDDKPDLLTANFNSGTASVLLGNGNGTFQTAATYSTGAGSRPFGIAAADINGDGKPDLLTASGSGTADVLLGDGDGTFQVATTYSTGPNSGSSAIAVADVNGDGKPDLLTANANSSSLGVLLNTTVASPPMLTTLSLSSGPVGSVVTLTGTNLAGALRVSFNGTLVSTFASNTATQLVVDVPPGATSGPVTVTTSAGTSNALAFTVPCPAAPALTAGAIGADQTVCAGAAGAPLISMAPAAGGSTGTFIYQWESSLDNTTWMAIPGATGAGYAPGSLPITTFFRRQASSPEACAPVFSNVVTITVVPALTAGSIAASQIVCAGSTPAPLTSTAPATGSTGTFTYQWESSADNMNWTAIAGATSADFTSGPLLATTYFRRRVTSGPCASGVTSVLTVMMYARPATPTLSVQYDGPTTTLTSSAATGNQFYLSGVAIVGATAQTYVVNSPAQLGAYTVVVTNATGCASAPSAPLTVTSSLKPLAGTSVSVYPNPTPDGLIRVELMGYRTAAELTVLNALGQVLFTSALPASSGIATQAVNLSELTAGVYVLRVQTAGGLDTRRIVKE